MKSIFKGNVAIVKWIMRKNAFLRKKWYTVTFVPNTPPDDLEFRKIGGWVLERWEKNSQFFSDS